MGVAVLAAFGLWVVRAPALDASPVANTPDVRASDAAPEQARASVSASDDRQAGVTASAASTAASGPVDERCGEDQRPDYGWVQQGPLRIWVMTQPGGLGYTAAQARIDAALRASADPFDRAVADLVNVGDMRTPAAALDAVAQAAQASSDPRLYALALAACTDAEVRSGPPIDGPVPPPSCGSLDARRWAQLDPGNGAPWLDIVRQAGSAHDAGAEADAWAHLAAAQRFDGYADAGAGAVLRRASADPEDGAAAEDLASRAVPLNTVRSTLAGSCRRGEGADVARLAQCQVIADTLFEHSDEQSLRAQGAYITFVATGDAARKDIARAERLRAEALANGTPAISPCELQRDRIKLRLRSAQVGEVAALREAASAPALR